MILFRVLIVVCILYALSLFQHGLSTMVTFSNQITLFVGCCIIYPYQPFYDILVVYEAFLAIVFYMLIVPLNGGSSTLLDAIIHAIIPVLFIYDWYVSKTQHSIILESRLVVFCYPLFYLPFCLYISHRRGYMIYPILNPLYLLVAGILLEFIRVIFCLIIDKKKKENDTE